MRLNLVDNQQALGFLIQQTSFIEAEIYRVQYPDILYPQLVPVDTSAGEWTKSITYFSMDKTGSADWFDGMATNMKMADISRNKFEQGVELAGVGYRYSLEELGQAMMIPGLNLTAERAEAARRAYEEFVDRIARVGDDRKGIKGLLNHDAVTVGTVAADGASSSTYWSAKTADQIIRDVQNALTLIFTASQTVEMADTVLLPIAAMRILTETRIPNTMFNALEYLKQNNLLTQTTGQQLLIRGILNLDTMGEDGGGRMVVYRRDPRIVKLHIPMTHRFLPVWQTGPMTFDIPGIFRLGSVEIRRPGAFAYYDGISAPPA